MPAEARLEARGSNGGGALQVPDTGSAEVLHGKASGPHAERRQQSILARRVPQPGQQGGGEQTRRIRLLIPGPGQRPFGNAQGNIPGWQHRKGGEQNRDRGNGVHFRRGQLAQPLAHRRVQSIGASRARSGPDQPQELAIELVNLPANL